MKNTTSINASYNYDSENGNNGGGTGGGGGNYSPKDICPKTITGAHYWVEMNISYRIPEYVGLIECIACGLIDDEAYVKNTRKL